MLQDLSRTHAAARRFDADLRISDRTARWSALQYRPECAGWPTLHLDDVSGIPFLVDVVGVELYQLRSRVRAGPGDVFCATCLSMPDYEVYNTERLGLGAPEFVYAPPVGAAIEVSRAARAEAPFRALTDFARRAGRLVIHPYMGIEPVWELGRALMAAAEVPVAVLGPPPPVCWLANDKVQLTEVVRQVCGDELVVASRRSNTASGLAAALRELAAGAPQVALKMARCASAMGNGLFESADVLSCDPARLEARVAAFLTQKEWQVGDEVLAVAWEATPDSPSTQLWIPPLGAGEPRVEGVYEQLLVGPEKVFLGSIPSGLEDGLNRRMSEESVAVARVFQALGYVGRCSFDFIVSPKGLRFVECNGRWGGTSTPMMLVDRLFPGARPAYRARDYVAKHLIGRTFDDLAALFGDTLYDARTGRGHFILYNVGCLPEYGKFDVIALGNTVEAASAALEDEIPTLLGRG